jgi:ATP-dependent DNA helicase RecQ
VEHFAEVYSGAPEGCGACDVCLGEIETAPDSLVLAQKILSAVVKVGQRYGASHVTDVLRGADTAALRRTGHDRLSTYGLLRELPVATIRGWIDQLVGLGHLIVAGDRYPVLLLSPSGVEVLKAQRDVALYVWPERRAARKRRETRVELDDADLPVDTALFERLRELRRHLARERSVPPYLIFNDRTLAELAARKPRTSEEFRAIKGVGDKKAAELGPLFLARIAESVG